MPYFVYDVHCVNKLTNIIGGFEMGILLTESATAAANGMSGIFMVLYIVFIIAFIYFVVMRPQKKEQKRVDSMLSQLAVGDSILTTSGFYGMVIDIDDENNMVIVEFGSNKNCRIPMNKTAIAQVEKPDTE